AGSRATRRAGPRCTRSSRARRTAARRRQGRARRTVEPLLAARGRLAMSAAVARRYFLRGREKLRRGELDTAVQEFGAAVELHPGFVEARVGYALTLVRTDPPRAAQSLRAGLARAARPGERGPLLCALGDV